MSAPQIICCRKDGWQTWWSNICYQSEHDEPAADKTSVCRADILASRGCCISWDVLTQQWPRQKLKKLSKTVRCACQLTQHQLDGEKDDWKQVMHGKGWEWILLIMVATTFLPLLTVDLPVLWFGDHWLSKTWQAFLDSYCPSLTNEVHQWRYWPTMTLPSELGRVYQLWLLCAYVS